MLLVVSESQGKVLCTVLFLLLVIWNDTGILHNMLKYFPIPDPGFAAVYNPSL